MGYYNTNLIFNKKKAGRSRGKQKNCLYKPSDMISESQLALIVLAFFF